MLALYLVYKGLEIFQIALTSSRPGTARGAGLVIGVLCIIVAVVAGFGFSYWADSVAQSVGNRMNSLPNIP